MELKIALILKLKHLNVMLFQKTRFNLLFFCCWITVTRVHECIYKEDAIWEILEKN